MKLAPLIKNKVRLSLIFITILLALTIIHIINYKSYINNIDNIKLVLSNVNPKLLLLFNIDIYNLDNPINYYLSFIYIIIIILSLYSIILGIKTLNDNSIIDNYLEISPLPKKIIYKKRTLASAIHLISINLILMFITYFLLIKYNVNHLFSIIFTIFLALFLIEICFYTLSLMLFTFIKNRNKTSIISILILSFFIILDLIYKNTNLTFLAYINPLSFFDFNKMVITKTLGLDYIFSFLLITFFSITFSYNEFIGDNYD